MTDSEPRERYRQVLTGSACIYPASVFDPISARIAHDLGFQVGMLAGSIASATVLGAPDLVVLTLTEFADQIRRITRAADLPLMVDADHGYGNALNVMRTVEELEAAGASALTIEDTELPVAFGGSGRERTISVTEMTGKLRAALKARRDPSLTILARTSAAQPSGLEETVKRVKTYAETGVDGIFLVGVRTLKELEAVGHATSLPLILGGRPASLGDAASLAAQGVRIVLQGHMPFQAAVRAVYETLKHLKDGGDPTELGERVAPPELMAQVTRKHDYDQWQRDYLT